MSGYHDLAKQITEQKLADLSAARKQMWKNATPEERRLEIKRRKERIKEIKKGIKELESY